MGHPAEVMRVRNGIKDKENSDCQLVQGQEGIGQEEHFSKDALSRLATENLPGSG